MNNFDRLLLGANGSTTYSGVATADTGPYYAIQTLAETTFDTVVQGRDDGKGVDSGDGLGGATAVPAGMIIYGHFTSVEITSGAIRCYKL